jgi:P-type E1-E2 ATPase
VEAVAIAVSALCSVVLGFIQERRAARALEALRRMAAPHATVVRDGEADAVPSRDLVPGDIILLEAGDIVPADARLLEAINLRIDEAALTGESSPVGKGGEALPEPGGALGDRTNLACSSTAVTYGRGRAVVIATGQQTAVGTISALLSTVTPVKTPLEAHLDRVGYWLARAALVVVALVVALVTRVDIREAMTMTFVSLVLIQCCKAYSFRSERHTVFQGTFANRWLNGAVLWELALLGLIIYVPILQTPFGTFPLPLVDWLILVGAALTIVPVLETAKWMERRGWFGPLE